MKQPLRGLERVVQRCFSPVEPETVDTHTPIHTHPHTQVCLLTTQSHAQPAPPPQLGATAVHVHTTPQLRVPYSSRSLGLVMWCSVLIVMPPIMALTRFHRSDPRGTAVLTPCPAARASAATPRSMVTRPACRSRATTHSRCATSACSGVPPSKLRIVRPPSSLPCLQTAA